LAKDESDKGSGSVLVFPALVIPKIVGAGGTAIQTALERLKSKKISTNGSDAVANSA
jgi:hypothetical protein